MTTRIYGASDDLIEFEGDVKGESGVEGRDQKGSLILCSDGTLLHVFYGKADLGIWGVIVIRMGTLFKEILYCESEDAKIYSDIAIFNDGLKWAYVCGDWEHVK